MGPDRFIVFYAIAFIELGVVGNFVAIIELALDNGVFKGFYGLCKLVLVNLS